MPDRFKEILQKYGTLIFFLLFVIVLLIVITIAILASRGDNDEPATSTAGQTANTTGTNNIVSLDDGTVTNQNTQPQDNSNNSNIYNPPNIQPGGNTGTNTGTTTTSTTYVYQYEPVLTDQFIYSNIKRAENVVSEQFVRGLLIVPYNETVNK